MFQSSLCALLSRDRKRERITVSLSLISRVAYLLSPLEDWQTYLGVFLELAVQDVNGIHILTIFNLQRRHIYWEKLEYVD